MSGESRGIGLLQVVWILAGILVAVAAGFHLFHSIHGSSVRFGTPYQAVLLTNGSVYFGHLQDYGASHPFLTDVFYVLSQPTLKRNRSRVRSSSEARRCTSLTACISTPARLFSWRLWAPTQKLLSSLPRHRTELARPVQLRAQKLHY